MLTYNETQFNALVGNYATPIKAYMEEYGANIDDDSIINLLFNRQDINDFSVAITGTGSHSNLKVYKGARNYEDVPEYFTSTFTPKEFNLAESFSRALMDDNKMFTMKNRVTSLMNSYKRTLNWFAATLFTQCDQTSFTDAEGESFDWTKSCDGTAMATATHTSKTGNCSTLSNKSTATTLNGDDFETAIQTMQALRDDNDQKGNYFGDTLLVPASHRKIALELIGSDGKPTVANNDYNIFQGHIRLIVWNWLDKQSGKTYYPWYLLDSQAAKDNLYWFDRIKPEITDKRDFETMAWKVGIYTRLMCGTYDWRWIQANIPA